MLKKNLFGLIIICALLMVACVPITQDAGRSMSQRLDVQEMIDRVNTSSYCVDPPFTNLDLANAARAQIGAYFWTFFLNFKDRVLEPESVSDWPARLRLSACFKLFARHTDTNVDKFVWIGETLVPCYLLGPNEEEHWITTDNLPQIVSKFNDQAIWKNNSTVSIVTSIKLTDADRIRCAFDFETLIRKLHNDVVLSSSVQVLSESDKTRLQNALNEISPGESEWFPYLHIFVGGNIERTTGDGVLIDFTPKPKGGLAPTASTACCPPLSFTTQVNDVRNLSVNFNGKLFTDTCLRPEHKPIALRVDFEPIANLTGGELYSTVYVTPYRVQFQYDLEDSGTIECEAIDAGTDTPVDFWPHESTVTIGGNIEGELYAVF